MFRLSDPEDTDLTPRSQKSQGLLAILLTSPDFGRPRAKLQDMLWSDRGQEQGAASLRQELATLKKVLGAFADVLGSDRTKVWLRPERFDTDCTVDGPTDAAPAKRPEFLEGNTIKDPEFTDWLRERRSEFEDARPGPAAPRLLHPSGQPERPMLFLSSSDRSGPLARHIAGAISSGIQDWLPLDVRDGPPPASVANAFLLETEETRLGQDAFVQIALHDVVERKTLWRSAIEFDLGETTTIRTDLARLINDAIDRTLTILSFDGLGLTPRNANAAIQAIERMFTTHGSSYEELTKVFDKEYQSTGHGVFLAWRAFLSTYVIGSGRAHDRENLSEEARDFVRRALLAEPHNPLVLALCSHVNAFTLGDHQSALELAERSIRLQPRNALGWMFRGVALINLGRLAEGRDSITRARDTTGEAPYRYLIDCYSCIAEMLGGNLENAVGYGATSLNYAPDFAPTLRYLLATHLKAGDMDAAERTLLRLRRIEPDFEMSLLAEPEYPNPLMKKYRILDLTRLPKML